MKLNEYSTKELVNELTKRTGVEFIVVEPYKKETIEVNGPIIVLKVND